MTTAYNQVRPKNNYGQQGPVIYAPPTTDSALVFHYDKSKNKFDRNFYTPYLTEGRSSSEQMDTFLSAIERKINKKMSKINKINKIFTIWAICGFVTMILFGFMIFSDEDNYDTMYDDYYSDYDIADTYFLCFMLYVVTLLFYSLLLQLVTRCKQKKAKRSVENYIKKHSGEFAAQGLKWNLPLAFPHWIELWKDYKVQSNSYPQALAAPQGTYNFNNNNNSGQYPVYQYPPMPQQNTHHTPLNVQPRQIYPSLMAQPLLAHQNDGNQNYVPPQSSHNNYDN